MLKVLEKKDVSYNAIFLSAFKALIVFELLLDGPKTMDEICQFLSSLPYFKSNVSKDTIRIYINSFKIAGCVVEKKLTGQKRRQYAYHIPENPFKPTITKRQAQRLFDIYDIIMYNFPFDEFLKIDSLIRKFDKSFKDENFHELYEKHSIIKDFDIEILNELENCCKENALVTILYNSPRSGKKEIPVIAHKMLVQNYKLYLEGFGKEYNQEGIFLVSRIEKIIDVIPGEHVEMPNANCLEIIYELYNPQIELQANEEIISQNALTRKIKHTTTNKVLSNHRFLELADNCKIIEPAEYRAEFINILKCTKEMYSYGN